MSYTNIKILFVALLNFVFFLNSGESAPAFIENNSRIDVVVIDPGHGGKDWGASNGASKEKDIVLNIALQLGNMITSAYPGVKVVYTRSKDVFIPLHQRANIANKNEADLFISIHVNGVEQKSVQGTETFVLGEHRTKDNLEVAKKENAVILLEDDYNATYEDFDPNSSESYIMFANVQDAYLEQSVKFASEIQDQFRNNLKRYDRSVKQAGFIVLRRTAMPSVLVETGFISNSNEKKYLSSNNGKKELASAIFNAFKEYKKDVEDKSNFHVYSEKEEKATENISTINAVASVKEKEKEDEKIHFSVQILALKRNLKLKASNFKGETNIYSIQKDNIFRYYSGKHYSIDEAKAEKNRLQKKYPSAFVVAFENNKIISVKKALGKM